MCCWEHHKYYTLPYATETQDLRERTSRVCTRWCLYYVWSGIASAKPRLPQKQWKPVIRAVRKLFPECSIVANLYKKTLIHKVKRSYQRLKQLSQEINVIKINQS